MKICPTCKLVMMFLFKCTGMSSSYCPKCRTEWYSPDEKSHLVLDAAQMARFRVANPLTQKEVV